jgi:hypothetical protein
MYGSYYGLEAGLLLVGLWLFRGSKYWRARTGADRTWQFSLAQLFLAMTVVAVLAGVMRSGPFADESKSLSIGFASSVVGMALASAMVWSLAWHWFLRFAATLGVALVLGEALNLAAHFVTSAFPIFVAHYLVQAIMLSAWLGWGPILPPRVSSVNAEMANSGR